MESVFGRPGPFNDRGEQALTNYFGEFSHMLMDVRVVRVPAGKYRAFYSHSEETAFVLLSGDAQLTWTYWKFQEDRPDDSTCQERYIERRSVFSDGPYALSVCKEMMVTVDACTDVELMMVRTHNARTFDAAFYVPEDAPWTPACEGRFGNAANRRVNTLFDYGTRPESNLVIGEVLNKPGNWSGYLPHRHPQPELYYFRFDRPEGFGACFVGDEVFRSTDGCFAAIPGGRTHPQVVAPGFQMYTLWVIRHLDGNPWRREDCEDDPRYTWLNEL